MDSEVHLPACDSTGENETVVANRQRKMLCCYYCGSNELCYITEYIQRIDTKNDRILDRFMNKQRMACQRCGRKVPTFIEYNLRKHSKAYQTSIKRELFAGESERLEAAYPYENPPKKPPPKK